jgi:hypothetical protein
MRFMVIVKASKDSETGILLHLESSVLADKFKFGFIESVET